MRAGVTALYHFARTADDLADEGDATPEARRSQLQQYRQVLLACAAGQAHTGPWAPVFGPLAQAITRHHLPLPLLTDLLDAFSQDTHNPRYADRAQLLDYCRRSANPVGRLILHMAGVCDAQALTQSDAICSALQLINFWQDVAIDLDKGRIYIPQAELQRFELEAADVAQRPADAHWVALMRHLTGHARAMLLSGAELPHRLGGRIGFELRLVIQGGLRILERIDAVRGDVFTQRPSLRPVDWMRMMLRAVTM